MVLAKSEFQTLRCCKAQLDRFCTKTNVILCEPYFTLLTKLKYVVVMRIK
jgi:hypothetical protein